MLECGIPPCSHCVPCQGAGAGPNAYRARLSPDLSFLNLAANQVQSSGSDPAAAPTAGGPWTDAASPLLPSSEPGDLLTPPPVPRAIINQGRIWEFNASVLAMSWMNLADAAELLGQGAEGAGGRGFRCVALRCGPPSRPPSRRSRCDRTGALVQSRARLVGRDAHPVQ